MTEQVSYDDLKKRLSDLEQLLNKHIEEFIDKNGIGLRDLRIHESERPRPAPMGTYIRQIKLSLEINL